MFGIITRPQLESIRLSKSSLSVSEADKARLAAISQSQHWFMTQVTQSGQIVNCLLLFLNLRTPSFVQGNKLYPVKRLCLYFPAPLKLFVAT